MGEIRPLTGLRGIAALIVFLAHTRETLAFLGVPLHVSELTERLFFGGGKQVDIFFVLSGFILALTYKNWFTASIELKSYFGFLQRRIARIYPLHFFILMLVVGFVLLAIVTNAPLKNGLDRFTFGTLPAHLLLVHAWGPFVDGAGEWNPPSWSVSIEAFAYLVFPFLMWLSARKSLSNPWLQIIAMVALGTALNAITPWGLYGFPGLARGVSEFALGCVAAGLFASPFAKWCQSSLASTICVLVLLAAFAITPATSFLIGVATVPLLFALAGSNPAARVVGSKPIYFLGEISYSIYLGHFLFSSISYRIISIEWMKTGIVPLSVGLAFIFAFVLVLSTICYYTIEKPGRNLLRRQKTTRRTVAANADVRAET